MFFPISYFSLKRHWVHLTQRFKKKEAALSSFARASIEQKLSDLKTSIEEKNRKKAASLVHDLEKEPLLKKSFLRRLLEGAMGLFVAIVLATIIRQSWFELYEIPTGSMRPTFREKDFLSVSKTAFGINIPLQVGHFLFDESLIPRGGAIIFTGENLDLSDVDTTFLGIFPYKKRYIKRLIGKAGDLLYFYGGTIIGIDKNGEPLSDFRTKTQSPSWMENLEYIPFISFEGKITSKQSGEVVFNQMNLPLARLDFSKQNSAPSAQFYDHGEWKSILSDAPSSFFDLYGMNNFAKARLIDSAEAKKFGYTVKEEAPLYLEIFHHPSLANPEISKVGGGFRIALKGSESLLPLTSENIERLFNTLYTARFVVQNGTARRYSVGESGRQDGGIPLPQIPDGTYEFYYGKGYQVGIGGHLSELANDHPLMKRSSSLLKKLYNVGIEFDSRFLPKNGQLFLPTRFAYFNNGDLYSMGGLVAKQEENNLSSFVADEMKRPEHLRFVDQVPPDPATSAGKEFLRKEALHIPEGHVLVLGDNHAMSGDSRIFGFVPHDNLQGAPSLLFWPPGPRIGTPKMVAYPLFNPSRSIVWLIALVGFGSYFWIQHYRINRSFHKKD